MNGEAYWTDDDSKTHSYDYYQYRVVGSSTCATSVFIQQRVDGWYIDSGFNGSEWRWEKTDAKTIEEAKALAETIWRMA